MVSDCATCGGMKVDMLPEHEESDECRGCEMDRPQTRIVHVFYSCDECGIEYRGPKFAEQCCSGESDDSTENKEETDNEM